MIRLLLRLPIVLLLSLPLSWAWGVLFAGDACAVKAQVDREVESAYPDRSGSAALQEKSVRSLESWVCRLPPGAFPGARVLSAAMSLVQFHLELLTSLGPLLLLASLAGLVRGLRLRERLHRARGYASPGASGLGRGLLAGALLYLVLFGASPLPVPGLSLGLLAIPCFVGAALYVSNLPLKL